MREIKFRGKNVDTDEWVYGDIGTVHGDILIYYNYGQSIEVAEVMPETVGQYTGLKDKNGVEVYEGDKVAFEPLIPGQREFKGVVSFFEGCWWVDDGKEADFLHQESINVEVIGNIHDKED